MINLKVNGKSFQVEEGKYKNLMRYLRDDAGMYSVKNGCEQGQCGACTVLVDGKAKRACVTKVEKMEGKSIETLENLSVDGKLHPIQQAFVDAHAIQCGFCTPGMIMATKGLLDENLGPTDDEIKKALKFNLCRCTGYVSIIKAVNAAASYMRDNLEPHRQVGEGKVGDTPVRKDVLAKVCGMPIYADDRSFGDMLHGKMVYARVAHAKINSVDISAAQALEGVVKVAVHDDIPAQKIFGILQEQQQILAKDEVLFAGDPVAVVYAETLEAAEKAAALVKVDLTELPGIFSPKEAKAALEPFYHGDKVLSHTKVRRGDTAKGFAKADIIIEEDFYTPSIEHAYIEPECGLSHMSGDMLTVYTGNQGSYLLKVMIHKMLDLPMDEVRVVATPAGGGFGGKEEPTVQLHCALGTYLTGRPVKITMTREESILASTKRHAEWMHYKVGALKDGTIISAEVDVDVDTGAYASLGSPVTFRSGVVAMGPYTVENVRTDSISYYTNNPVAGAFRGFGSTQVTFTSEVIVDMIAEKLGIDPFEIRLKNGLAPGKQTITGQTLEEGEAYLETLLVVREALEKEKGKWKPSSENKRIGIGIASSYKNVGLGIGLRDKAGAIVEINEGGLYLYHGAAEIGQGASTTMAQIASEVTDIPYAAFTVVANDTHLCPDGEETTASRQTYISGNATKVAAEQFMEQLEKFLKEEYSLKAGDYRFAMAGICVPGNNISWEEIFEKASHKGVRISAEYDYMAPETVPLPASHGPHNGDDADQYKIHAAYCFATQAAIVEVDVATGAVEVKKIIAANDVGRAINPAMVKGQIEGGVMMGLGYGLSEELKVDQGKILSNSLAKCGVPKITATPEIEALIVEKHVPGGPFGAKGMGELPLNPTAPAIANAVFDAVGYRAKALPLRKEDIKAFIDAK